VTRRSEEGSKFISIRVAVRRTGLDEKLVQECVRRQVVREPLTERDVAELRRIRRLRELGVNMPGIEVILHMRRRIQTLQAELARQERSRLGASREQWILMEERWQRLLPPKSDR
jgi:hypothetical protein